MFSRGNLGSSFLTSSKYSALVEIKISGQRNFGASLKAFERLGHRLGYALVHCEISGANAFFVRQDLVGERFAGPFDAETHYEPPRYSLDHNPGHRRSRLDREQSA